MGGDFEKKYVVAWGILWDTNGYMLEGYYGETLKTYLALVLYTKYFLLTGVGNRPLVPAVCVCSCVASMGGAKFALCGNGFFWAAEEGKWFSVPHPETECSCWVWIFWCLNPALEAETSIWTAAS